jgi:hypothetical protein
MRYLYFFDFCRVGDILPIPDWVAGLTDESPATVYQIVNSPEKLSVMRYLQLCI